MDRADGVKNQKKDGIYKDKVARNKKANEVTLQLIWKNCTE
jgi:hypothetical protein